ncbi:MAG TPA: hypothetical protein VFX64_07025 [Candidatus Nitrosotalea sp.]|nr:hypothetical protein [Candidatus Nitrosotalea sp.]
MKTIPFLIIIILCVSLGIVDHNVFADSITRLSQTAADKNHVYVAWDGITNGTSSMMFAQSSDNGDTFAKHVKLADNIGIGDQRKIVSSDNDVYLVWSTDDKNNHSIFLKN